MTLDSYVCLTPTCPEQWSATDQNEREVIAHTKRTGHEILFVPSEPERDGDPEVRASFRQRWGTALAPDPDDCYPDGSW